MPGCASELLVTGSNPPRDLNWRGLIDLCLDVSTPVPMVRQFGDFELRERLGSGGMGSVWRAWQQSLQREVALKLLHEDLAREPVFIEAFRREAELTATLRHPGIVPVFATGEADGIWFYAMEWVDADNFEEILREHETRPVREAVTIVRDAAAAVGYVHGKGVLHRDLKPSNLLIDAAGAVRVLDFGLARLAGLAASGRTAPVLGTPHYVAPEQGKGDSISPAADVYSLGAVLYRALCGRTPFTGESPLQILDAARHELPVEPSRLNPAIPADISQIIQKCLEKSPSRRYRDATALADDLTAWLEGRPVAARPIGPAGKLNRWVKREPLQALLVVILLGGATSSVWLSHQAAVLRREATRDRELAALQRISSTLTEGHRAEAKRMFKQTFPADSADSWGFPARLLRAELAEPASFTKIPAHHDKIWGLCTLQENHTIATTGEDGAISLWQADDLKLIATFTFPGGATPFGISPLPGGERLLVGTMTGASAVLNAVSGTWEKTPLRESANWLTTARDGAIASLNGNPHFWTPEGTITVTPAAGKPWQSPGKRAEFSPDGSRVAIARSAPELREGSSGDALTVVGIFETGTGRLLNSLKVVERADTVRSLAWSSDGRQLAAAAGKQIILWNPEGGGMPDWSRRQQASIWDLKFQDDTLFSAGTDQSWCSLDRNTGTVQQIHRGHENEIWCLATLPGGVVITADKSGQLGRSTTTGETATVIPHGTYSRPVFSPDGRLFTVARTPEGSFLQITRPGHDTRRTVVRCTSLHGWDLERNALLASLDDDQLMWIAPDTGEIIHRLPRLTGHGTIDLVAAATGIANGLCYECTPQGIFLRDTETGEIRRQLEAIPLPVIDSAIRADGRYLAISSNGESRVGRLYDLSSGSLRRLPHQSDEVLGFAFSPDGRWLASGGGDAVARVWSLADSAAPATLLQGHLESVQGLAFTRDSRWLLSSCSGESLRFWETGSWEAGPAFPCPEGDAFISFSPDDQWLAVSRRLATGPAVQLLHAPR